MKRELPIRCVLFFINKPQRDRQLLAIDVDERVVDGAVAWTYEQVRLLRSTADTFATEPEAVVGGELAKQHQPVGKRLSQETTAQYTACGFRFDCPEYTADGKHLFDVDPTQRPQELTRISIRVLIVVPHSWLALSSAVRSLRRGRSVKAVTTQIPRHCGTTE